MSDPLSPPPATGQDLFAAIDLPQELFPPSSWARAEPDNEQALRCNTATNPSRLSNGSMFDDATTDDSQHGAKADNLLRLYGHFSRSSEGNRLWSRTERYQLLHRLPTAGLLAVVCFRKDDGTMSPPTLLVGGPLAVAHMGLPLGDPDYLQQAPDPSGHIKKWPETLSPLVTTLASSSRTVYDALFQEGTASLRTLAEGSNLAVFPDAKAILGFARLTLSDSTRMDTQGTNDPFLSTGLWAEDIMDAESNSPKANLSQYASWLTGAEPPSPLTKHPWSISDEDPSDEGSTGGDPAAGAHLPQPSFFGSYELPLGRPNRLVKHPKGGMLILSKVVLLPEAHGLPIGFIADPTKLSFDAWVQAMGAATGTEGAVTYAWLDQPVIRLWFEAVAAHPQEFSTPLERYDSDFRLNLHRHMSEDTMAVSALLHLE